MAKWVYMFTEGNADMRNLLGGKGANLDEMTNLGLPVPQGFTVTTEACTPVSYTHLAVFLADGCLKKKAEDELKENEQIPVCKGHIVLRKCHNRGVADVYKRQV